MRTSIILYVEVEVELGEFCRSENVSWKLAFWPMIGVVCELTLDYDIAICVCLGNKAHDIAT